MHALSFVLDDDGTVLFSSCEGDRGDCQEYSSVVFVLFTCHCAVYKYILYV